MIDYAGLFDRSPNPYMVLDRGLHYIGMNRAYLKVTGRSREELLGRHVFEAFPGDPGEQGRRQEAELLASLNRVLATGERDTIALFRYAIPRETPQGTRFDERFWSVTHTPLLDDAGEVDAILQHAVDVTEVQRLRAELHEARGATPRSMDMTVEQIETNVFTRAHALQKANRELDAQLEHLLRLFDSAPGFMAFLRGPDHVYELANAAYLDVVGRRDVIGRPVREVMPELQAQGYFDLMDEVYRSGRPYIGSSARVALERPGGGGQQILYIDFVYQPVVDTSGAVTGILLQGHNMTSQKLAQEELARYRNQLEELVLERTRALERSQEQLRHAQKMEAIGKLTGGVAHDFNNVLQVIGVNLELLDALQSLPERAHAYTRAAMNGVDRGARIASQLLAFARRQPLQPLVLEVGEHLRSLHGLLRNTLGEAIELDIVVAPDVSNIEVDPHQLDNVLVNLAINARDAIRGAGRVSIRAGDVHVDAPVGEGEGALMPGHYVLLSVSDTGRGMSPDVLKQAFEPFFTTKEAGHGTGLGLSMVYGFVRQSGGHIAIESEPYLGSVVRIHLPRSTAARSERIEKNLGPVVGGHETVLVVEDDLAVRTSLVAMLRSLGYRIAEAPDARTGIALLEAGLRPDVLLTDVVMPGPLQSVDLARRARELHPGVAVLYMSGYTEEVIFHDGRLDPDVDLLGKPFLLADLARKLREVLDHGRRKPRGAAGVRNGPRVLLVEDNAVTRSLTAKLLRTFGMRPHAAATAGEARAALAASGWDALLTDVALPDGSGVELAQHARECHPQVRVVFATGHSAADLRGTVADAVLQKPYRADQLRQALEGDSGARQAASA